MQRSYAPVRVLVAISLFSILGILAHCGVVRGPTRPVQRQPKARDVFPDPEHERWDVKTLGDGPTPVALRHPIQTTVQEQSTRVDNPEHATDSLRRQLTEDTCYVLLCTITKVIPESDGDYHLYIESPEHPEFHMFAEIPDPDLCGKSTPEFYRDKYRVAREAINIYYHVRGDLNRLPKRGKLKTILAKIEGVGFWDKRNHAQGRDAPNGREIHPILKITVLR